MSLRFDVSAIARAFKPRKALLYAPSGEISKLEKAAKLATLDTVAFDLEDGVPENKKQIARNNVREFLSKPADIRPELAIRINSIDSANGMKDLNQVFLNQTASKKIKTIILPKVEDAKDVQFADRWLRLNGLGNIRILAMIESPLGLARVNEIASSSHLMDGLIFGAEDFRNSCGITREFGEKPIIYARSAIVAAAKAFQLQAIDMTSLDFKRKEVVEKDAAISRAFGFTGKQVIHPMQIDFVNSAFMPSQKEVERCQKMIKTFVKTTIIDGKGVYGSEGEMVELPHIKDAVRSLIIAGKTVDEIQKIADSALN